MSAPDPFAAAIGPLLDEEGRYSNNPADPGGETMFGITVAVARANGYAGPMAQMSRDVAVSIYKAVYWTKSGIGGIAAYSPRLAAALFDIAVNMGIPTAGTMLQRSLNVLNEAGRDYADVTLDGTIGAGTLAALKAYLAHRGALGETVLLKAITCLRGARYIAMTEANAQDESFIFGWLANRVELPA